MRPVAPWWTNGRDSVSWSACARRCARTRTRATPSAGAGRRNPSTTPPRCRPSRRSSGSTTWPRPIAPWSRSRRRTGWGCCLRSRRSFPSSVWTSRWPRSAPNAARPSTASTSSRPTARRSRPTAGRRRSAGDCARRWSGWAVAGVSAGVRAPRRGRRMSSAARLPSVQVQEMRSYVKLTSSFSR